MIRKILAVAFLFCISNNIFSQASLLAVGNINPGDSIVIYYDVTINTGAGASVTNQGTITGSNFANLVTDDPKTFAANDPTITFLNVYALPVTLYELRAAKKAAGIEVTWNVSFENNILTYEVEKSTDGRSFTKIGEVPARNSFSNSSYIFFDQNPNSGVNFYRLHLIDQTTSVKYSVVVRVDLDGKNNRIRIYPNPVVQQTVMLQLNNIDKGNYELLLYNNMGQLAYRKMIIHDGGSAIKNILLPQTLLKGVYNVQIKTEKQVYNQSVIIQ